MAVGLADTSVAAPSGNNGDAAQPSGGGRASGNRAPSKSSKPTNKSRGDGHSRDPQKAAAGKSGDNHDFDDPMLAEAPKKPAKKADKPAPAKKPAPQSNGRREHDTETNKDGRRRAAPPEAASARQSDSESGDSIDGDNSDPYEALARKYDPKDGKPDAKKPADRRKPAVDDDAPELEVGDELADDQDDDDRSQRRDIHADDADDADDDRGRDSDQDDDGVDAFDHPMLARAKAYGFNEEDARSFGTPEALERAMDLIDSKVKELSGAEEAPAANGQPGQKPADGSQNGATLPADGRSTEAGKTSADAPGAAKLGEGERSFAKLLISEIDKNPETGKPYLDAESQGVLQKIADHFDGVLSNTLRDFKQQAEEYRQLKEEHERLREHYKEGLVLRAREEWDTFFDGLEGDYEGIFGKGSLEDLDPESTEAKNRVAFVNDANVYAKGLKNSKEPITRKALRARVLRGFKPAVEKREENIRRSASDKARRRERQRIAEPTGRGDRRRDLSPDERAAQFATSRYQELGFRTDPYDDDFDGNVI